MIGSYDIETVGNPYLPRHLSTLYLAWPGSLGLRGCELVGFSPLAKQESSIGVMSASLAMGGW